MNGASYLELHSALERFGFDHWRAALRFMEARESEADAREDTDLSSALSTAAAWVRTANQPGAGPKRSAESYFKIAHGQLLRAQRRAARDVANHEARVNEAQLYAGARSLDVSFESAWDRPADLHTVRGRVLAHAAPESAFAPNELRYLARTHALAKERLSA